MQIVGEIAVVIGTIAATVSIAQFLLYEARRKRRKRKPKQLKE